MSAIYTILSTTAAVTGKLANGSDSIYTDIALQTEARPYIIIEDEDDKNPLNTFSGPATTDEIYPRVLIFSDRKYTVGSDYGTQDIAEAVRQALDAYSGTTGGETISDIALESESSYTERYGDKVVKVKEQTYQIFKIR